VLGAADGHGVSARLLAGIGQERLNKEIKRRTGVVGIFPDRASVVRLVGMILAEQGDEWQDGRRYFRPETMAAIDATVHPAAKRLSL